MTMSFLKPLRFIERMCYRLCSTSKAAEFKTTHLFRDTIFSVSSGQGKCGVAVIRISGSQALNIALKMGHFSVSPTPRKALVRSLFEPKTQEKLDCGLVIWFPGPNSYTGEDCLELQVHGGMAVVSAFLKALGTFSNTRHADPGEFTKRAFINGKMDLTEVEGLADMIHAETEAQRRQALRQMSGELQSLYSQWRQRLIKSTASVEAFIDFSEEENIEDNVIEEAKLLVEELICEISRHLSDGRKGQRLRDGLHVAIIGKPNVGKSSLLNYLTRRPLAIVSPIPGTTRDLIETHIDLDGYPVLLVDTAGLRKSSDTIEQEGVRRAINRSLEADLILLIIDAQLLVNSQSPAELIRQEVEEFLHNEMMVSDVTDRQYLIVVNKMDLLSQQEKDSLQEISSISIPNKRINTNINMPLSFISLASNFGLHDLMAQLTSNVKDLCGDPLSGNPTYTQDRHRNHITQCLDHLLIAKEKLPGDVVIAAEHLRLAGLEVGRLTGAISTNDILDVIFKDFCIGK